MAITKAQDIIQQRCSSAVVEEAYSTRCVRTCDGNVIPMNTYIPREQGDLLYSVVRTLRPSISVEVGMANGLSTAFITDALKQNGEGRHIAIDPFQHSDWHGAGSTLLRTAGCEHLVELIELPSHQALPELERRGVRAQFVFIDGNHLFDYVMTDFLCADRLLDVGGMIAFDDSDWLAVRSVLRYVLTNRHYRPACPGIVIEEARYNPTLAGRALRGAGRAIPKLGDKLDSEAILPSFEIGIRGRCVVLEKMKEDDRDGQSRFHHAF